MITERLTPRPLGRARLLDRRRLARRDATSAPASRTSSSTCSSRARSATRAQEIAEIFDALGGELNAATSREHTVVYARVADHHLETALDVMSDMVFAPLFAELDSEREVVLEEIAMYEDTPQELVHDLIAEAVFGDHPLGRPVIGTARGDLVGLTARASRRTTARCTSPGNVVVAAAGNLEHERARRLARAGRAKVGAGPPPQGRRVRSPLVEAAAAGPALPAQGHRAVPRLPRRARASRASDRRRFAASLLDAILGGSASSRLFQEIREKRGMAYAVYSFASQYTDTGQIGFYVGTREENLGECLEIAAEQIADDRRRQPAGRTSSSGRRRT